jgi:hypothetical protein
MMMLSFSLPTIGSVGQAAASVNIDVACLFMRISPPDSTLHVRWRALDVQRS